MTGLQVWLHPSSRTTLLCGRNVASYVSTDRELNSTALRRTAAVVRDRRGILNVTHLDARSSQRANGGLATRTGTADPHLNAAHTVIARHNGGVRRRLLRGEWRSLA